MFRLKNSGWKLMYGFRPGHVTFCSCDGFNKHLSMCVLAVLTRNDGKMSSVILSKFYICGNIDKYYIFVATKLHYVFLYYQVNNFSIDIIRIIIHLDL